MSLLRGAGAERGDGGLARTNTGAKGGANAERSEGTGKPQTNRADNGRRGKSTPTEATGSLARTDTGAKGGADSGRVTRQVTGQIGQTTDAAEKVRGRMRPVVLREPIPDRRAARVPNAAREPESRRQIGRKTDAAGRTRQREQPAALREPIPDRRAERNAERSDGTGKLQTNRADNGRGGKNAATEAVGSLVRTDTGAKGGAGNGKLRTNRADNRRSDSTFFTP